MRLLGLAEQSFGHVHGGGGGGRGVEAVQCCCLVIEGIPLDGYAKTDIIYVLLLQLHLIRCCTRFCLLSATYMYIDLLVSSAFSFSLNKLFMFRLFRFVHVHQQLCQSQTFLK